MKILLAEDDTKSADYVRQGLIEQGFVVDWVSDGREALTYCLYNEVDLLITDRMMPGIDGLALVKSLRSANIDIPGSEAVHTVIDIGKSGQEDHGNVYVRRTQGFHQSE
ncbi:MAG: response regulator, partial [Pseudomonadota bacterium]